VGGGKENSMSRISVPVEDLHETAKELQHVGDLISNTATLYHAAGESSSFKSFVGDSRLATALDDFDKAWVAGHERVKDNVKVFVDNTKKIADNFTDTDDGTVKALDESKKES
jgi:hypothetical protein